MNPKFSAEQSVKVLLICSFCSHIFDISCEGIINAAIPPVDEYQDHEYWVTIQFPDGSLSKQRIEQCFIEAQS